MTVNGPPAASHTSASSNPRRRPPRGDVVAALEGARARSRIRAVLRRVFGLSSLREGQQAVIEAVVAGRHTLAIMPTGAGKSLCYQVPAMLRPGMTVVVSPLIALMRDQVEKIAALGIPAVQVNSTVGAADLQRAQANIGRRRIEFVFTTPEQLASSNLEAMLAGATVDLLVIDEAHCISQWGHDFRPAYLEALNAIRRLGSPTVLALTATAPPEVVADITRHLQVGPLHVVNTGAHRPNLHYRVLPVTSDLDKQRQLLDLIRTMNGAGVVYAATVRHVDELARLFQQEGVAAVAYHGRMRAADRSRAQDAFMTGGVPLIVATNAFGMGIDRPDIRFVVHYDLPASLDVYYQESGRAGRDGAPADCVLLFQRGDRRLQQFFMAGRYPTREDFGAVVTAIRTLVPAGEPLTADRIHHAASSVSAGKLRVVLTMLAEAKLLQPHRRGYRESGGVLHTAVEELAAAYDERRGRDRARLEQMVVYAQTATCRTRMLLGALGDEPAWERCEQCDNCTGRAVRGVASAEGAA